MTFVASACAKPKRQLVDEDAVRVWKKRRVDAQCLGPEPTPTQRLPELACARLETTNDDGTPETGYIYLNETLTIGRHPASDIFVDNNAVSRFHCKIYAISAGSEDGIIISCQVPGQNGMLWNGHQIRPGSTIILLHGDVIELKGNNFSRTLRCYHTKQFSQALSQRQPPSKSMQLTASQTQKALHTTATIGRFAIQSHVLGSGSHAVVRLAVDTATQRQVACKSIELADDDHKHNKEVMKEVKILKALNHPNINGILEYSSRPAHLHLFLELCTGSDLHAWLNAQPICSEPESRYIAFQLIRGLAYLHSNDIAHRDLKPENILLHAPGRFPRVLIADFGFSRSHEMLASNAHQSVAGTPSYMPPEAIRSVYDGRTIDFISADCWSFGTVLFQMITRTRLFDDERYDYDETATLATSGLYFGPRRTKHRRSIGARKVTHDDQRIGQAQKHSQLPLNMSQVELDKGLARRIIRAQVPYDKRVWRKMPEAQLLVSHLLCKDVSKRYSMKQALASSWIVKDLPLLEERYRMHVLDTGAHETVSALGSEAAR